MKKKIIFSILTIFAAFLFVINVNAKLSIPNTTKAVAPDPSPSTNDVLYGTVTESFSNFSKLKFEDSNGDTINGISNLRKIVLGSLKSSMDGTTLDGTFADWFTAYCLDNNKKYPEFGIFTNDKYDSASDEVKLDYAVLAAIADDENIQRAISNNSTIKNGRLVSIQIADYQNNEVTNRYYTIGGELTAEQAINIIEGLTDTVTIKLEKIGFLVQGNTSLTYITASDITRDSSSTTYDLVFKGKNILLEKYNVTAPNTNVSSFEGYNHALWIIEHSYPTLSLQASIEASGADYTELINEICTLEGGSYNENTCSIEHIENYVENYVYGTIQYAIWKVTGHGVNGDMLGDGVVNSNQLDKLYKYLIDTNRNYSNYSAQAYSREIKVEAPKEGKELYKETSSSYVYGPYKASYHVLEGGDMELSIKNTDKTGIKIVNESGEEISTLKNKGTFYIECKKSAKISSVSVGIVLRDATIFNTNEERGRIYFPKYVLEQNLMSGGKIINTDLETGVELVVNPKTGVENVALLLMVTLVAFTLAYLVLSYKQKQVQQLN